MRQYEQGVRGEEQAERWLTAQGMRCLDRRWRGAGGELDLIMEDGGTLVFVEVKSRPRGRAGEGLMAIGADKRRRMAAAAAAYLTAREEWHRSVRFDVVEITADGLRHVRDAFRL